MPRSLASSSSDKSDKSKTSQASSSAKSDELVTGDAPVSLGGIQHLDRHGKVITDPDRSNPTRPRLERPLDTLRGFEDAIRKARRGHPQPTT
ncbi:DUF2406 domain-containing protein [Aspergillus mulundensis]|uniref:Uncharacterized protein n=1 Tax=Aspergillus mulundensis TaxID=1810919 RepID=A0A3D8QRU6_9EURO|nr:hypothetical protein DSM5745_09812 [Aspergillus mulundensis]RDW64401.1 hypothetical protein DSM5745_09812 [Aspergillus mulundensis]